LILKTKKAEETTFGLETNYEKTLYFLGYNAVKRDYVLNGKKN
jgi:hypothetical protein